MELRRGFIHGLRRRVWCPSGRAQCDGLTGEVDDIVCRWQGLRRHCPIRVRQRTMFKPAMIERYLKVAFSDGA
ncbi:MAG: hypothetical protein ACYS4W_13875 [Planctomycetota bacterium]